MIEATGYCSGSKSRNTSGTKRFLIRDCFCIQHAICRRFLFDLACQLDPFVAMPQLKVSTLRGDVLALDVTEIQTVQQLKARLLDQFICEDPIEQKICRVAVFQGNCLLDDAQTLNEVGLDAEPEVSVVYTSNEIEAASKNDVNSPGFFGVIIPQDVTKISEDAFRGCHELVKVVIPHSKTSSEEITFTGCTCIGDNAFAECKSLENINIPDSVTIIGHKAFSGCSSLENINIPDSVTSIGDNAFSGCNSLKNINIPDSVTSTGYLAFAECKSLESIAIPDSVTSIPDSAFRGCSSLKNINIPDSVTSIGYLAFAGCSSLVSINIPSMVQIRGGAFIGCNALESIVRRDP